MFGQVMPVELTPDEQRQLRNLLEGMAIVREWEALTLSPAWAQQPVSGSELAEDDRRTGQFQMSGPARTAIMAAIDNLACLRDCLFRWTAPDQVESRIQIYGPFALVRGGLENASRAVWMLEPDDRDERILRRLRLDWDEWSELEKVRKAMGAPPTRTSDEHFRKLTAVIQSTAFDPGAIKSLDATYTTIVKAAGQHLDTGSSRQLVIWKGCSAIAHGDYRGTLAYLAGDMLAEVSPGFGLNPVTANVPLLTAGALDAIKTVKVALRLYGKRAM
jgi:hypothetical protein